MKFKFITQTLQKIRYVRENRKYKKNYYRFGFPNRKNSLLTVYDKKLHEKTLREEGREEGRAEERERSLKALAQENEHIYRLIVQEKERTYRLIAEVYCEAGLSKIDAMHRLMEKCALEQPKAETIVNEVYEQKG